jgi:hypothetical protein
MRPPQPTLPLAAVALAFGLAACGTMTSPPAAPSGPAGAPADDTPDDRIDAPSIDLATIENRMFNQPLEVAEAQAEMWDVPLRVGRVDDERFALTEDYVVGRITVEVDTVDGVPTVTGLAVELPVDE